MKKRLPKRVRVIVIVSIALLIIILLTVSGIFSIPLAKKTSFSPYSSGYTKVYCNDSDGGQSIYVKGFTDGRIKGIGKYFNDTCVASNGGICNGKDCTAIAEGYCGDDGVRNYVIPCPDKCSDGRCIISSCKDSDNGFNYTAKGYVYGILSNGSLYNFSDYCVGNRVVENYCGSVYPTIYDGYYCPNRCEDGACKACNGCISEGNCFTLGYRMNGTYCSSKNYKFVHQVGGGGPCNENYECIWNNCKNYMCGGSLPVGSLCNYHLECQSNLCINKTCSNFQCTELIDGLNNLSLRRLNLIFLGIDYDLTALKIKAESFIDLAGIKEGLFSIEPFKSNKNKFNFWFVNTTIMENDGFDNGLIQLAMQECLLPNWYGYVYKNEQGRSSSGFGPNSFTVLIGGEGPVVALHETGHLIGNLYDEYASGRTNDPMRYYHDSMNRTGNMFYDPVLDEDNFISVSECRMNSPWKEGIGKGCGDDSIVDCIDKYLFYKTYMIWDKDPSDPTSVMLEFNSMGNEYCDYGTEESCNITLNRISINPFNPGEGFTSVVKVGDVYRQEMFNMDLVCKGDYEELHECLDEVDCFPGGLYFNYNTYRPTFQSRMRGSQNFGSYNEYLIQQQINKYSN
ncbi:MAG: hypothetical protein AABX66_02795 [Nanoarchaeota archaeon]